MKGFVVADRRTDNPTANSSSRISSTMTLRPCVSLRVSEEGAGLAGVSLGELAGVLVPPNLPGSAQRADAVRARTTRTPICPSHQMQMVEED